MDNSVEQDQRIMDYQRQLSAGLIDHMQQQTIKAQLKNVQRVLQLIAVRNPYATYIKLPDAVFKPRRTMMLLLLFTETITFYHQIQRELKTDTLTGERYIETTIADVEAAFSLLETILLRKSDELTEACRNFFERLKGYLKTKEQDRFYSREIRSAFRVSASSQKRYLMELERMGYISILKGNRYKGFEYKVTNWNDMEMLTSSTRDLVKSILDNIRSVAGRPSVAQPVTKHL